METEIERPVPITLDTAYVLSLMANKWNSEHEKAIREPFVVDDEKWDCSDYQHRYMTGRALKLAKRVLKLGGTEDEVDRVLKYLHICINMKKHRLDAWKAFDALRIGRNNEKYILVMRSYKKRNKESEE